MILTILLGLLILSGIGIVVIDHINKPSVNSIDAQYDRIVRLWNFTPIQLYNQKQSSSYKRDVWSWRKLLLAGYMISSSISSIFVKRSSVTVVIVCFSVIIFIWIVFITIFWYTVVNEKYNSKLKDENSSISNINNDTTANTKSSSPWLKRSRNSEKDSRLPLTIVTGFLGSGKTSLIKHILNNTIGLRILVIENEIGEQGIDHDLLLQQITPAEEDFKNIILLNNGCICCSVRKDLLKALTNIISNDSYSYIDWIVIETSGLADPAPFIQSIYMDKQCQEKLRLDSVLTIVDSKHISNHFNNLSDEAIRQLMYADRILLNKIDLLSHEIDIDEIKNEIVKINPVASILTSSYGKIDLELILNIKAFDPKSNQALADTTFNILKPLKKKSLHNTNTQVITLTNDKPLDMNKINFFLCDLLQNHGTNIYRMKGIMNINGYDEMFVFHSIHMIFDGMKSNNWNDRTKQSKLIIIGKDLDQQLITNKFYKCIAS